MTRIQAFCVMCDATIWFEIDLNQETSKNSSGIIYRTLIHDDHVLNCEIDNNGSVRKASSWKIIENPIQSLGKDVTRNFFNLNVDDGTPITLDIYTNNRDLIAFFTQVISEIVISTTNQFPDNYPDLELSFSTDIIKIKTNRYDTTIGLKIRKIALSENIIRGIILDMRSVEEHMIDLEETIKNTNFVGILSRRGTNEPYYHAISSLCQNYNVPFFIEALSTNSIKSLFDFLYAMIH